MATAPKVGGRSPWGKIDHVQKEADGIWFCGTPSHGGLKLSRQRQDDMPAVLRLKGGWYEEDVDYNRVIAGLPRFFKAAQVQAAREALKNWCPDEYAAWTGYVVPVEESHVLQDRHFAGNWVVIAAFGDWSEGVPEGMVGVITTRGGIRDHDVEHKNFLVPKTEYGTSGGNFVVDPTCHEEVDVKFGRSKKTEPKEAV